MKIENQKRLYFYDRWFELVTQKEDSLIYYSIPRNASNGIKLEINQNTNEIIICYIKNKQVIRQISITNIFEKNIELHYSDVICELMMIGDHVYDNLAIEVFTNISNDSPSRKYELMFSKREILSNYEWKDPILPINQRMDIDEIDVSSDKVNDFIEFVASFPIEIRRIKNMQNYEENSETTQLAVSNIAIPQEIIVYDRVYKLVKVKEDKIILTNQDEDIRNLEIKYDPFTLQLQSVSIKMKKNNKTERVLKIEPNDLNGITVQYRTKVTETVVISEKKVENAKVNFNMVFDKNKNKVENNVLISTATEEIKLLEHPVIGNNYTDGNGNLYTLRNQGYNTLYGVASFAPGIFNSIKEKVFVKQQ